MELYFLKSGASLALLYFFYKLFLEQENMHVFKRFYLLASLIFAFVIPLITFTHYVEAPIESSIMVASTHSFETITALQPIEEAFNWSLLIWTIYGLGVLFFSIKFLVNLSGILQKISNNPKQKLNRFINVLLNDAVIPHTFFNYIFLNKCKFESQDIPEEVLLHEQTHAKQKHSLDVVFVELLQIVFWFNPFIYVIKHAIKLNHEFLADQAVLNKGVQTSQYQEILLAFSSDAFQPQLANSIHYSLIKKRFNIMKTKTSKQKMWLRSFIVLPLLALLVFSFSEKKEVITYDEPKNNIENVADTSVSKYTARSIDIEVLNDDTYLVDGIKTNKKDLVLVLNQLHQDITLEIRNRIMNVHVTSTAKVSDEDVWYIYYALVDYGFHRLVTEDQEVIRAKGNKPMVNESTSTAKDFSKRQQQSATREQMAEYTKLAKHYNALLKKRRDVTIKMQDVQRLKYLFNQMSDKQIADAEPFPDFPEPPPMPDAPEAPKFSKHEVVSAAETGFIKINGKDHYYVTDKNGTKYYNRYGGLVDKNGKTIVPGQTNASDVIPGQYITKVYKDDKIVAEFNDNKKGQNSFEMIPPPPPPPPAAPPTMEELAEKGAVFYLEGKQITAKKAIDIVNNNKRINIQILNVDSKQPKVKLSKKPYTHKSSKSMSQVNDVDQKNQNVTLSTGNTKINGKDYFYSTKDGTTSYFNSQGEAVDQNGKVLDNQKRKPTFYFNGKQISSEKANKLLSSNKSITVVTEDYNESEYAIVLSDLSKTVKNPNNINHNLNNNPNSLIDLTEVISKGATFYYNNVKISTEKAKWLTKYESIERVQTKEGKDGKPKVYFWKKA